MARRMFYVDEIRGGRTEIRGEAAQHVRKVLRAERGYQYEISDNESLYLAEVTDFGKDLVVLEVKERLEGEHSVAPIHLFPALVKFDAFEWMLEKATELGAARITPVYAARSDKGLDQAAAKRMERWRRIILESGQQSRRVTRPELAEPVKLKTALAAEEPVRLFLEELREAAPILGSLPATPAGTAVLIGPEGGWDDSERKAASEWSAVSLGPHILRAETAAVAVLAVLNAVWSTTPRQPAVEGGGTLVL
jgi:16S rRNA (uracil1498-N3)-methyltransferase